MRKIEHLRLIEIFLNATDEGSFEILTPENVQGGQGYRPVFTYIDETEKSLENPLNKARKLVFDYVKERLEKTDTHVTFIPGEVYVVWFCKTLQNWKALCSTTLPDGMYYEVTYDGDRERTYIDAYKKFENVTVEDYPLPPAGVKEWPVVPIKADPLLSQMVEHP